MILQISIFEHRPPKLKGYMHDDRALVSAFSFYRHFHVLKVQTYQIMVWLVLAAAVRSSYKNLVESGIAVVKDDITGLCA